MAVTGLVGAAAYGAVRTNISRCDLWFRVPDGHEPTAWMMSIGLEPTDEAGAPLRVAIDRTGAGVLDARPRPVGATQLPVAHRVRIWVDVYDAARGPDIAQELIDWSRLHDMERDRWMH